jgi:hypothetical protein
MMSQENEMIINIMKAKNEFEWIRFLIDIEYFTNNKIELIDIPDFETAEEDV